MSLTPEDTLPGLARVGIGGPVGSGKTALVEQLIPRLVARGTELAVITNDLVTREDAERLKRTKLLPADRIVAVEAGACPHTVIREDPTLNIEAAEVLERRFAGLELILIESGGDNLASTFSLDLVDYWLFVIDVAGGGDIPRKRGPGVLQCDLLADGAAGGGLDGAARQVLGGYVAAHEPCLHNLPQRIELEVVVGHEHQLRFCLVEVN